jgi:gluconate 5-dehydrogenase
MTDPLFSVRDQVVLVSGGSRGIGRALAGGFAERGARVIVTGREEATITATAAELSTGEHAVTPLVADVADVEATKGLVARVLGEFGRIDTLLNVAGVNKRQPAVDFTPEEFDFVLGVNLRGAFFLAREVGLHMLDRGSGSVVNIDSLNSYAPLKNVLPYAASKAGLCAMTRALAAEWGPRGVRVNGLAPGFILTDLTRKLWSDPTMQTWVRANTPLGRLGNGDDLIGTAVFLASPAAAFLTGQTIYIDGGVTCALHWPIPE